VSGFSRTVFLQTPPQRQRLPRRPPSEKHQTIIFLCFLENQAFARAIDGDAVEEMQRKQAIDLDRFRAVALGDYCRNIA
jgi:hypothetical protein